MKPTKLLRHFLGGHPELQHLSTQRGLAQLVYRSESLLRAVEGGGVKLSLKFARAISDKTGVSREWLMEESVSGAEVPALDGSPLRYETVIARLKGGFDQDPQPSKLDPPMASEITAESSARVIDSPMDNKLKMAAAFGDYVKWMLIERASRGETGLIADIGKLLSASGSDDARGPGTL